MKNIFTRLSLVAGLVATLAAAAFAQATTTAPQDGAEDREGRRRIEGRMRGRGRLMGGRREGRRGGDRPGMEGRVLKRLNLSDAQRGQLREIETRYGQSFKAQREELHQLIELRLGGATLTPEQQQRAQQLRGEARDNGERMRAEILALLTPEQRDELKRIREEGAARRNAKRDAEN
jgi:Spy/CpxP family protein refolding chaperone